jgi:uncharacterized protein (DUF1778 family)
MSPLSTVVPSDRVFARERSLLEAAAETSRASLADFTRPKAIEA